MTHCEEQLFSYADLPLLTPWLSQETCREFAAAGLFTPRKVHHGPDADSRHMNLYDLIALSSVQQLLRCGITADKLRQTLYAPASFRCDDFPHEDLLFLSTGGLRGQELSRFLEVTNAEVTVLIRVPLVGDVEIEFIPNDLLGPKDYGGETLTGVECRAIRDAIRTNMASAEHKTANGKNNNRLTPQA